MHALLCLDIGNTHAVLAVLRKDTLLKEIRIPSSPLLDLSEYVMAIERVLAEAGPAECKGSVISSVVPRLTAPYTQAIRDVLHHTPLIVDHTLPIDLKIRYDDPSEVGADRICNAVGALERYSAPLIVVDMGTATTFDVVSADREYLGGVIMPGLETAGRDLFKRAARLPRVSFDFPEKVIGTRTRESLQSGLMWGTVDQIDGLIQRICDEWKAPGVTIVATGGLAGIIAPHSRYIQHVDKALTLFGMKYIYEQVTGASI
ncbi:MAG: type III pantothenate kinase [Candidatus Marinimicrobia bacterium]|nr:type III pantothenate kinase [Candidatus Neomarinimicrobiota bacterium]